jgi:positive regulator of sigma E activity
MIDTGRVLRRLDGGRVEVEIAPRGDCGDCKICESLAGGGPARVVARNPIGASKGEVVRIELEPRRMVGLSALVFLLPIAAFAAGYLLVMTFVGQGSAGQTALSVAGGAALMVLCFIPVIRRARRQKAPLVRVIDRVGPPRETGDVSGSG